jgi:hypothetical protein
MRLGRERRMWAQIRPYGRGRRGWRLPSRRPPHGVDAKEKPSKKRRARRSWTDRGDVDQVMLHYTSASCNPPELPVQREEEPHDGSFVPPAGGGIGGACRRRSIEGIRGKPRRHFLCSLAGST